MLQSVKKLLQPATTNDYDNIIHLNARLVGANNVRTACHQLECLIQRYYNILHNKELS